MTDDPFFWMMEKKVREAIERGELDNLPGKGKPLDLEEPPPFVSRDAWRMMKILKNAGIIPPEVQLLKEVYELREKLKTETNEAERARLTSLLREKELQAQTKIESFNGKFR